MSISRKEAIQIPASPRSSIIADCSECDPERKGNGQTVVVDIRRYINVQKQIEDTACEMCEKKALTLGSTT